MGLSILYALLFCEYIFYPLYFNTPQFSILNLFDSFPLIGHLSWPISVNYYAIGSLLESCLIGNKTSSYFHINVLFGISRLILPLLEYTSVLLVSGLENIVKRVIPHTQVKLWSFCEKGILLNLRKESSRLSYILKWRFFNPSLHRIYLWHRVSLID